MSKRKPRKSGMRRSHLKRFSGEYINAGKKANSAYIQEMAKRSESLTIKDIKKFEYFEKNMTHANRAQFEQASTVATRPADDVVFDVLKKVWRGTFWQGIEHIHRKNLLMTQDRSLFLFISGQRFFFVAEKRGMENNGLPIGSVRIKRSAVYPTHEMAMMAYESMKIRWVDEKIVANMPSVLLDGFTKEPKMDMERIKFPTK